MTKVKRSSRLKHRMKKSRIRSVRPVLMDTAPLLLFLAGNYDPDMIGNVKKLKGYSPRQYQSLYRYIQTRPIYITPQSLAEMSNLATASLKGDKFTAFIESSISFLHKIHEEYIPLEKILDNPSLSIFGFTDVSIMIAAQIKKAEVITEDIPLLGKCRKKGIKSIAIHDIIERERMFNNN